MSSFLRRVLVVDGVVSAVTGLLLVLDAGPLQDLLRMPAPLLRYSGLSLFPFAALVLFLASRAGVPRAGVRAVIAMNAAWVVASVVLLLSDAVAPNALGAVFVVVQALAVAVLAELEYVGLRKSSLIAA
jgi:hypothetical protein